MSELESEEDVLYETKCRRCGHISEWVFGPKGEYDSVQTLDWKYNIINSPGLYECEKCDKQTVHDVVGFNC